MKLCKLTIVFVVLAALLSAIGCTSYAAAYKSYAENSRTIIDCSSQGGCPGLQLTLPGKIDAPYEGIMKGMVQMVGIGAAGSVLNKAIDKIDTGAAVAGAVVNTTTTTTNSTTTTDASTQTDDHSSRVDDNSVVTNSTSSTASTVDTSSVVSGDTIQDSYNTASSVADSYNPATNTDSSTTNTDASTQTDDHSVDDHSVDDHSMDNHAVTYPPGP